MVAVKHGIIPSLLTSMYVASFCVRHRYDTLEHPSILIFRTKIVRHEINFFLSDYLYRKIFPSNRMLEIQLSPKQTRSSEHVLKSFSRIARIGSVCGQLSKLTNATNNHRANRCFPAIF